MFYQARYILFEDNHWKLKGRKADLLLKCEI